MTAPGAGPRARRATGCGPPPTSTCASCSWPSPCWPRGPYTADRCTSPTSRTGTNSPDSRCHSLRGAPPWERRGCRDPAEGPRTPRTASEVLLSPCRPLPPVEPPPARGPWGQNALEGPLANFTKERDSRTTVKPMLLSVRTNSTRRDLTPLQLLDSIPQASHDKKT